jgi:hypothetical protein
MDKDAMSLPQAPPGYEPPEPPRFDGGSEADRRELLELYWRFRIANDHLDSDALRPIWSENRDSVFFNTNGHAYYGADDFLKVWDHYRPRVRFKSPGGNGVIRAFIRGDLALLTDDHMGRDKEWIGDNAQPQFNDNPYVRVTLGCLRQNGSWKVIHAHWSPGRRGLRPDQGGAE